MDYPKTYRALMDKARAFQLMAASKGQARGRVYALAKELYAASMRGDNNIAKRPEVKSKISMSLQLAHPYRGKKRPEHANIMRARGHWIGKGNPRYGTGARQEGERNHMARRICGSHSEYGTKEWGTLKSAAEELGVSIQAVSQAIRRNQRTKGWAIRHAV